MSKDTIDRAYKLICDRPGITRGQLTAALATPGRKGSDRTSTRVIAFLRDTKHFIASEGHGYRAIVPASAAPFGPPVGHRAKSLETPGSTGLTSVGHRAKSSATPESKGLSSSVPFGPPVGHRANSINKEVLKKKSTVEDPRMESEEQEFPGVGVDTPGRSTIPGIDEQDYLDANESNMSADVVHSLIPSQFLDLREDLLSLLAQFIEDIKKQNTANGYLKGIGRKSNVESKKWRHLQYAHNHLDHPQANISDLQIAIECLRYSGYHYETIPWEEVNAECPEPASRKFSPIIHPGPPEDWMDSDSEWEDEVWRAMLADTTAPQSEPPGVSPAIPTTEPATEPVPAAIELTATQQPSIPAGVPVAPAPAPEQTARPTRRVRRLQFYDDLAKERAKEEAA